jgi:hypothetical protein
MNSEEAHVEGLLTHLSVDDEVASRVTDDGEILYRAISKGRLRVAVEADEDALAEAYQELHEQQLRGTTRR